MTSTPRINSPADLAAIREKAKSQIELRTGGRDLRITVHMGTCGIAAGARDMLMALMNELHAANVDNVTIQQSACAGLCDEEPMITISDRAGGTHRYGRLDKAKVRRIVQEHVVRGNACPEFYLKQ
jgi:(2Fe-2S) ferredoxin